MVSQHIRTRGAQVRKCLDPIPALRFHRMSRYCVFPDYVLKEKLSQGGQRQFEKFNAD